MSRARSLRTRKTATIAFVSDIVDHVLLIAETQGEAAFEQHAIDAMLDRQVDGVIYAAMATRQNQTRGVLVGGARRRGIERASRTPVLGSA